MSQLRNLFTRKAPPNALDQILLVLLRQPEDGGCTGLDIMDATTLKSGTVAGYIGHPPPNI